MTGETMRGLGDQLAFLGGDTPAPHGFSLDGLAPDALFAFADRRCRIAGHATARDLLLRASALRKLGCDADALADLRAAFRRDADDPLISASVLAQDPDPLLREHAARALIGNPRSVDASIDLALRFLTSIGTKVVLSARRAGAEIRGWAASLSQAAPTLMMRTEEGVRPIGLSDDLDRPSAGFPGRLFRFAFDLDAGVPCELTLTGPDGGVARARLYASEAPRWPTAASAFPGSETPSSLNVIVPLYRDHETAKACLEALALQDCAIPLRIVLVDDHSPEPEISALAERFCRLHEATLIVNRVNHGFAGAVNRAIMACGEGDCLLLNSDVTLPPGALDRLIRAAYRSPRVGTVMPLSNDSELTSFPLPFKANPLPTSELALRIDDAAHRANGDATVEIVNTIGYCVYVKADCLRATGLLSQRYGRGYYEDVELSLKAREKGFISVAATGIFVSHGSGRSFGEAKPGLLSHNLPILCEHFPAFREENAAFLLADPLRQARGAIEVQLPPREPTHLLVGAAAPSGGALALRAQRIVAEGGMVLTLCWRQAGATTWIDVRGSSDVGPHSLSLKLDGVDLDVLIRYVLALPLVQIELGDLHTIPSPLYRLLLRTSAPILFFIASLEDALLVSSGVSQAGHERLTSRDITVDFLGFDQDNDLFAYRIPQFLMRASASSGASKFVTSDSMAEAVCANLHRRDVALVDEAGTPAFRLPPRWQAKRLIAIPVPFASPGVDRLLLDLARHLRSRVPTILLVMGRCVDDRALMAVGNVLVTGPAGPHDYPMLIDAHAAEAIFLPYRTSMFAILDALSSGAALPRAYFDWSAGLMPARADDVVLDCRLESDVVCSQLARWCAAFDSAPEAPL